MFIKIKEQKIHYHHNVVENKKTLVFIHGAGGNTTHWPPNFKRNSDFGSIVLDLPGHGKSEGVSKNSIEGYVDFLSNFIQAIGVTNFILVGHSMGGVIAQSYALEYPGSASGLILLGSGSALKVLPLILALTQSDENSSKVATLISKYAYSPKANESLKKIGERMLEKTPSIVLNNDFTACDSTDITDRLSEIRLPTLIICGKDDKMTPVSYSENLHERISGSELHLLDGVGHMVALESPEKVYDLFINWLAK